MAKTPEKRLEIALIAELAVVGWWAHHIDITGYDGWPDILAIKDGRAMLIECKVGTTALRESQKSFHDYMGRSHGTYVHIVSKTDNNYVLSHRQDGTMHSTVLNTLEEVVTMLIEWEGW